MSTQMQLRGGTTAENLLFTGAQREITVDTDKNTLIVHDGATAGGFPLASSTDVDDGTFYYNEDAGSAANAYVLVPKSNTNVPSGYIDGVQFGFVSAHPNTGPSTANFQSLGVKNLKYPGGVDPLAGDISGRVYLIYDAANGWLEIQRKATDAPTGVISIGASVGSGALTATLLPRILSFRSSVLGSGTVNTRSLISNISVVIPSGATLGTVNAVPSRIVLVAIDVAGTVELAVINLTSGVNLDEASLISTVAITAGASLANVFYSTTLRSNVPFRVVGFFDSTQATAGNWATSPSRIQGGGGSALTSLTGLGSAQIWRSVTGSRALATTYTNSTGRPIEVCVNVVHAGGVSTATAVVDGVNIGSTLDDASRQHTLSFIVPAGSTYRITITAGVTLNNWAELS